MNVLRGVGTGEEGVVGGVWGLAGGVPVETEEDVEVEEEKLRGVGKGEEEVEEGVVGGSGGLEQKRRQRMMAKEKTSERSSYMAPLVNPSSPQVSGAVSTRFPRICTENGNICIWALDWTYFLLV